MNYLKNILLGFLGGAIVIVLILILPISNSFVFNFIKSDIDNYLAVKLNFTPSPTPIITNPNFWQKIVSDNSFSTVAIQTFKGGKVIREGSGMVIASDGIILTTFDVVVGNADVYQIFYNDKILRAQLVKYDGFKNLALLKIPSTDINVTRFEKNYQFQPGQDLIISGKKIKLSESTVFAQKAIVNYIMSNDIVLDAFPNYFISGAKVINNVGMVVGMSYLRNGVVRLITAETIDNFIKEYFDTL
jgi:S1-C subfamily serine protease